VPQDAEDNGILEESGFAVALGAVDPGSASPVSGKGHRMRSETTRKTA